MLPFSICLTILWYLQTDILTTTFANILSRSLVRVGRATVVENRDVHKNMMSNDRYVICIGEINLICILNWQSVHKIIDYGLFKVLLDSSRPPPSHSKVHSLDAERPFKKYIIYVSQKAREIIRHLMANQSFFSI